MPKIVFVMPRCAHDHVRAVHKQARSLYEAGHEVVLVARNPAVVNYLGMEVVPADAPHESVMRPVLNLVSLYRQITRLFADVYIVNNPDTILLALLLRLSGRAVIYDTYEDFSRRPEIRELGPFWLRRTFAIAITACEKILARSTVCVLVTQPGQRTSLGGKTLYLPNAPLTTGPIVDQIDTLNRSTGRDTPSLVYIGSYAPTRGILRILNMIERLNHVRPCVLVLAGFSKDRVLVERMRAHSGWKYVEDHGHLSHAEALAVVRDCDVGLAVLDRVADYPTSSITKLYEYMQFGVPFIASDFPAWKIPERYGEAGVYVDPDDEEALDAAALSLINDASLRRDLGQSGKAYIYDEFNWENIAPEFVSLVEQAAKPDSRATHV